MNMINKFAVVLFAGLLTLLPGQALAGPATEQFKESVEKVIKILEDPALRSEAKTKERRVAIRRAASDLFDFSESAKRSLAHHWQSRSGKERDEFIKLFGDVLERTYFSKIEQFGGDKIAYLGESIDGDQATLRTKITTKGGTDLLVDYRMLLRGTRWLVYDVSFDGVSLIANYRTQFNKIIQTSSYQELVKKMKTKQDEYGVQKAADIVSEGKHDSVLAAATILAVLGGRMKN